MYTYRVLYAYATTYGTCTLIHAHSGFGRSQTIFTVCVRHFSSVWVCRHTARIKTRGWRRSDADCRFRLFCSIRGQHVNPRPSVTVALGMSFCVIDTQFKVKVKFQYYILTRTSNEHFTLSCPCNRSTTTYSSVMLI